MISYCIPYFNNSSVLPRCLTSIKRVHEVSDVLFEVVIIDDCSEDLESKALIGLIQNYSEELPIRMFRLKRNRGVTFAKNQAYIRSFGGWCVIIDTDDYFEESEALLMLKDLPRLSSY